MRDPDKNPNIVGSRAHEIRVERDKVNVLRGSSQVYTNEGRNFERKVAAERRNARTYVPVSMPEYPTSPVIRRDPLTQMPAGKSLSTPASTGQRVYTGTVVSGPSPQTMRNIASGITGLIGAGFASAHGVTNGVALTATFIGAFMAAAVALHYFKQIVGFAVLALGVYAIISHLVGH